MARTWKYTAKHVGWLFAAPFPEDQPLRGASLGVLARVAKWQYDSVCVCFGVGLDDGSVDVSHLTIFDVKCYSFGQDRGFREGRWKFIAPVPGFSVESWPLPVLRTMVLGLSRAHPPECKHVYVSDDSTLGERSYANDGLVAKHEAGMLPPMDGYANPAAMEDTMMRSLIEPDFPHAIRVTPESLALWARIKRDVLERVPVA
jgi:hypothetical protein